MSGTESKKRKPMRLHYTTIFAVLLTGCAKDPPTPTTRNFDWSGYPQDAAFTDFRQLHDNPNAWRWGTKKPLVLAITWFLGPNIADVYVVSERGEEFDVRVVHNWAMQASHHRQMDAEQMRTLSEATAALPSSRIQSSHRPATCFPLKPSLQISSRSS